MVLRRRALRCLSIIAGGLLSLAIWLAGSGKRFTVDIRVVDAQLDSGTVDMRSLEAIDVLPVGTAPSGGDPSVLAGVRARAASAAAAWIASSGSQSEAARQAMATPGRPRSQGLDARAPSKASLVEEDDEELEKPVPQLRQRQPAKPQPQRGGSSDEGESAQEEEEEEEKEEANPSLKPCTYLLPNQVSSRPGRPCIPPAPIWPYTSNTPWRTELGERIVKAVTPKVTEEQCEGWHMFGDQTWCNKAMKRRDVIGLSFGIEERDLYSEYLSNHYKVPTRLFDCFIEPEKSPPIAGTAPNGTRECGKDYGGHCYETPYESFRVCLGAKRTTIEGRSYNTLENELRGRGPLSTHVKIDVEGSEWSVLERLIASDADQAKIRTLDMEIHFGFSAASEAAYNHLPEKDRLLRQIRIIEGLRKRFYCTGSTLEVYRQGWFPEKDCVNQQCHEPVVHTAGGFSPQMFAVSYVNRAIVDGGEPQVGGEGGGAEEEEEEEEVTTPAPRAKAPKAKPRPPPAPARAGAKKFEACEYKMPHAQSSRPGPPCLPPAKTWPYKTNTDWRTELGERILRAVTPHVTEEQCGGWILFGDQTWCKKVMKSGPGLLGLSFGIEERDMYSEYLSNHFRIRTRLFDCFQNPAQSPPLSGKAPNGTGEGSCRHTGDHCYETPYEAYRVCLGAKKAKIEGRNYETLSNLLKGRGRLSTYVKIDVEGSEWSVLEQFIANDADQAKVRTLDMEIHFAFHAASESDYNSWSEQQRIEREIKIIEGLRRRFHVTGTTLEVYRQGWQPEQDCPTQQCDEPSVHLAGGFSPRMFAISFVNRAFVDGEQQEADRDESEEAGSDAPEREGAASGDQENLMQKSGSPRAKYGFYLHVFNYPAAVVHQVRSVKEHFPDSPIYVMSDGGMRFDGLCKKEGCTFQLCPPANDRWHPWPFLHRLYDAAVTLNSEYVIMLEPDNTIHGPITRHPTADAGGLPVKDRKFGQREYIEGLARKLKPGFRWTDEAMSAGLAGGAYFKTEAILDAFSDEAVAQLDWNLLAERGTKEIFSSDFAMQFALAARGWEMEPWEDCAQMERDKENPHAGAKDAAFRHYCGCYPGGKPTYNLQLRPQDERLVQDPLPKHNRENSNCQICYDLDKYIKDWGSAVCTNPLPFKYSKKLLHTYFPDGNYPKMR